MEKTSHMLKLEAAGIKIYKIRFRMVHTYRGKVRFEDTFEKVIIDNEESARTEFHDATQRLKNHECMRGYSGFAELIHPHIFESGGLAYWGETLDRYDIKE
jgi:hypothetical protein